MSSLDSHTHPETTGTNSGGGVLSPYIDQVALMQGSPIRNGWGNVTGPECGCHISGERDLEVTSV